VRSGSRTLSLAFVTFYLADDLARDPPEAFFEPAVFDPPEDFFAAPPPFPDFEPPLDLADVDVPEVFLTPDEEPLEAFLLPEFDPAFLPPEAPPVDAFLPPELEPDDAFLEADPVPDAPLEPEPADLLADALEAFAPADVFLPDDPDRTFPLAEEEVFELADLLPPDRAF